MGRLKESEVSLRQAITLKPDLAEAHGSLGIIAYLNGDIDLALASIQKASILNPNSKPTTFLLNLIKSRKLRQNIRFDVKKEKIYNFPASKDAIFEFINSHNK